MKNFICLLITLVFSQFTFSENFPIDMSIPKLNGEGRLEIAKNLINDLERRSRSLDNIFITVPDEDLNRIENEVCVSCDRLIPLAQEINDIISKQSQGLANTDELKLENRSLEAIISYVQVVEENGNRECHKIENFDTTEEFRSINEEELIFVFSEKATSAQMRGAMYSRGNSQVAFFRGKGADADKLVRVDMDKDGETYITYYLIKNVKEIVTYEDEKRKLALELSLPSLGGSSPERGEIGQGVINHSLETNWNGEKGYVKASIGPQVEYNNFLPKKITIVDMDNEIRVSNETTLKSEAEVTSNGARASIKVEDASIPGASIRSSYSVDGEKQSVGVSLRPQRGPIVSGNVEIVDDKKNIDLRLENREESPYVYMRLEDEGNYLVGVPYKLESGEYGIGGELQYQNTGESRANMSLLHQGRSLVDTSIEVSETERRLTMSRSQKFRDDSTLSINFTNTQSTTSSNRTNENSFWLSYQKRF